MADRKKTIIIEGKEVGLKSIVATLAKIARDTAKQYAVSLDTSALKKAGGDADSFYSKMEGGQSRATKSTERFSAANRAAGKDMASLSRTSASALTIAYAEIAANVYAAAAAFNALKAGAQYGKLIDSQKQLAASTGQDFTLISKKLKEATGNALDFQRAAQYASLGKAAGLSTDQITKLAAAGTKASIALGRDLGDSIDRIFRGTIKGEPEILDELGIIIRLGDASAEYAKQLNIRADSLTTAQKTQAVYNATLKEAEKFKDIDPNPDAFTKLSGAVKDAALNIGDFLSDALGPMATFLANNQYALVGLAGALSSSVLGKAIGAFGSDLADVKARADALAISATKAKEAVEANKFLETSRRSIASDSSTAGSKTLRTITSGVFSDLGDTTKANNALKSVLSTLNEIDEKTGKFVVSNKGVSEIFTAGGKSATSFSNQVINSLTRMGDSADVKFGGIEKVARETMLNIASVTKEQLLRAAESQAAYAAKLTAAGRDASQATLGATTASTQAAAIQAKLTELAYTDSLKNVGLQVTSFKATTKAAFASVAVQATAAGAAVSAAFGWISLAIAAGAALVALADYVGLTSDNIDKFNDITERTSDSLSTMDEQLKAVRRTTNSLAESLSTANARAGVFDSSVTNLRDSAEALAGFNQGILSSFISAGDSDLEESLRVQLEYAKKVGYEQVLNNELKKQGLSLGKISDTNVNAKALQTVYSNTLTVVEKLRTIEQDRANSIKQVQDAYRATADASKSLVASYNTIDPNLQKILTNQRLFTEELNKSVSVYDSISDKQTDYNVTLKESVGYWAQVAGYILSTSIGIPTAAPVNPESQFEERARRDFEGNVKQRAAVDVETITKSISILRSANTAVSNNTADTLQKQLDTLNSGISTGMSNLMDYADLSSIAKKEALSANDTATKSTLNLIALEGDLAKAQADRNATLQARNDIYSAIGISAGRGLEGLNAIEDKKAELVKLNSRVNYLSQRNADGSSSDEISRAKESISTLEIGISSLELSYSRLNPEQIVFGNSLKTIADRTLDYAKASSISTNAKDSEILALTKQKELLEANGQLVDVLNMEKDLNSSILLLERLNTGLTEEQVGLENLAKTLNIKIKDETKLKDILNKRLTDLKKERDLVAEIANRTRDRAINEKVLTTKSQQDDSLVSTNFTTSAIISIGESSGKAFAEFINTAAKDFASIEATNLNTKLEADKKAGIINQAAYDKELATIQSRALLLGRERALAIYNNKATIDNINKQLEATTLQNSIIEKMTLLATAIDQALDAAFNVGDKSIGDVGKDLLKGLTGSLFKDFKLDVKKQLDESGFLKGIGDSLGSIIPDSVKGFFASGAGKSIMGSFGGVLQSTISGYEQNGAQGALIAGAFTALGAAVGGPIGAAIGGMIGQLAAGTKYQLQDAGLRLNASQGNLSATNFKVETKEQSFFRGTKTRNTETAVDDKAAASYLRSFEAVNQSFTGALNRYAAYFEQDVRAYDAVKGTVFGETLSFKGLSLDEQQTKIQQFFQDYGDALVDYSVPGLDKMQKAGETLIDTLNRVTRVTMTADIAFKSIFNLGTGDAKNLLGSTNKEGRLDLARGMLSVVQDDLNFAYSFLNAQGLKVKATPPKEKKSFFSKFAPIILGAVLAVVLPGIGAAIGAALQGIGAATLGASVLAAGSAGTLAAAAGGIGALASGAIVSGLMSLAGAAIISSAYGALAEGIINAATGPGAETFNLGTSADNFGANLEGIQKAMKDYAKFTFTLTADQFALNLESGLFEATEERVRLFRSKGGKKNAEKLQAEYEKQINLLNEYSAVITYLTLEAAGINTGGTGIEAKAMQQLRMKYFDDVIGFFEGEDIKAKEEAFNKAISSLTQSTSSILEVVVNGVDGAINGIKASIYTIGGVFEKQKKEMLDALDFNSDLFDSLSKDIKGSSITSIKKSGWRNQKKVRYASNQKIVEDIYGSFIGNLGLSAEDQMSAYAKLSAMTAEDVAALGNLQGEIDQRTFLARFGSSLAPSKVIMAALTKAIPLIKEKFNDLNATFAAFDTFYTGLEVLVPNDGQLPSLVRFNKLFEETVATSQDPEVFAEMVKIGETISEAIKQLFEVFRGFNVEDLVGYLDNAIQVAKSFTELGSFVADEFIKGTRAGLKDTFKNAIIEDFQKNLLSPILSALTPAISAAFAGQSSGLNIQLNDQEIADTASRLDTTANLLLTLLDNPALNAALDKVGDVFANLGTKFAGLAEQSAKLTTSLNDALKEITDNLELDAYSALVKGNAFSIAEFKTRKKVKELNISGFDESIITQPFEAVVAKVRTLIASGAIGEGNLDGVIEALRGLGEMATSAREQLQKAVEDTQAAYDTVSGSIRDISLTLIKAIKPKTASDLAKSQAAIGKYLQGVYLDVEKAKSAFADARMSGDMSAAAEAAGVLQSSLVEYMNARIDGEQFLADLQKTIYDDQKKSLEDMVEISKSFGDFLKDLKYDETLSILKPSDRLQEATTDFNALKSKIFGSDISSLTADTASTLIEDARRLLDLGRQNYASGDLYTQLYNDVVGVITQLQAQVDAKSTTLEEATRAYQDNDLALQEQIRNIQLGTLYQLQNIGSYLAGNNALASSALSALIFNQPVGSIDPTQIFADIFANTNQASLFSSAAGSNFDISSVLSSVLNSVGGGINGLLTNVTGDSTGDIANTQIQQLLSSYTGFSSIGDLFPEFDTELATLLKQLNTQQVAPTGTASTPVNVTVTAPEGTNEQTIARLTELLERLEAVLGALPAAMRTAIVQQSIAGARI